MNVPRSILQRRRFLQSSSVLALGAASTLFAARKLSLAPRRKSMVSPASASRQPAANPGSSPPPGISSAWETEPAPPLERPLENEESYNEFLLSLDLRHLTPREIIDPHRGVVDGIENSLPPQNLWEKLAPTLKAADEIRERLQVPLCRITSGYRSPRYNANIPGAVRGSYHTRNQALDLVYFCSPRKAFEMALQLRKEGFFRGGVGFYPTFIHLDTRGYAATWRRG
ncbi:MAG: D-Ala-D-Ala carboxypeptidase family metallohydrolase [Roseibacillus sp.]|nr:D-Ala-D-Ala carboxypeptidase family metallohydrolase [Roseibacillus sp.]